MIDLLLKNIHIFNNTIHIDRITIANINKLMQSLYIQKKNNNNNKMFTSLVFIVSKHITRAIDHHS
jgi:hypothetical protein